MEQDISTLLTAEEVAFVKKVFLHPGYKLEGCFHHVDDGTKYGKSIALWENPEKLGLIKPIGSYKWEPVNLEMKLFTSNLKYKAMATKLQFSDLTVQQCESIFKTAFYESPNSELDIQAGDLILIISTEKYNLCIEWSGKISAGVDKGVPDEYSPYELDEGNAIRQMLTDWGVPGFTEPDFITWLGTQRNYDQSSGDNFFGTYMMGPYHFATVYRKNEGEPYTYIIHGSSHSPGNEFIRTTEYLKFMEALDKIGSWSLSYQQERFEEDEDMTSKRLAETTERNMNLISKFLEHIKYEAAIEVPEAVVLSFFNA